MSSKKVITVIGATGAQGSVVTKALLAPYPDGTPSPYAVRALTRNPTSPQAKELVSLGAETVKGSFQDFDAVLEAFKGAYGAYVNTDGFTVGEEAETFAGMRIFELAKQAGIKHYVWGNLEYATKRGGYDPQYRTEHLDGKGRIAEWLKAQESTESGLTWSVLTSGPYMDMLQIYFFGPLNQRRDGTFVFASPIGDGHVPMCSLKDIGFFARYIFDHPRETSGRNLGMASEVVSWPRLVEAFTKVTGQKAVFLRQSLDEWFDNFEGVDYPVAHDFQEGFEKGLYRDKTTYRKNFSGFWRLWRDDLVKRDMDWVYEINPGTEDLEKWMKRVGYTGGLQPVLKNVAESKRGGFMINTDKTKLL